MPIRTIRFGCAACGGSVNAPLPSEGGAPRCRCGEGQDVPPVAAFAPQGFPERCPVCPGDDLYLQRDFPRRAGVSVMAGGAVVFLILAGMGHVMAGFAVLGGVAAADLVLFRLLPLVTVCYRCGTELRGLPANAAHTGFDHHRAEEAAKHAAVDRANRAAPRAGASAESPALAPGREAVRGA